MSLRLSAEELSSNTTSVRPLTYMGMERGATANDTIRPMARPMRQGVVRTRFSYFMSTEQTDPTDSSDTRKIKPYENPIVGTSPNAKNSPDAPPHTTRSPTLTAVIRGSAWEMAWCLATIT